MKNARNHEMNRFILVHRLVKNCPTVNTGIPVILLNQAAFQTKLPEHRQPWCIRINEHTFTSVVNLEYSFTGWADCLSWIVRYVRLSAKGADHLVRFLCSIRYSVLIGMIQRTLQSPYEPACKKFLIPVPLWSRRP